MDVHSSKRTGSDPLSVDKLSERGRSTKSISLVLPAYNEEEVIAQAVHEADLALNAITQDYEILVVDDGSDDQTANIVNKIAADKPQVKLVRQPKNLGYGAALRRGFSEATKQLVGFTDADCQFDLNELDRFVLLARDYDIVCGYRIDRKDTATRCFFSNVYNHIVRLLLGTVVRDCDCALKLFRRETLGELSITTDGYLVNAELLSQSQQLGKSLVEVGVTHRARAAGQSKVSLGHVFPVFAALLRFWWTRIMFPASGEKHLHDAPTSTWSRPKHLAFTALLMGLAAILFFGNIGYPLIEPDETRYAQIPLEMVDSGNWIVPTLHGEPYLDKPPLLYWLISSAYSMFGQSPWSARLPIAISALLTVLATYLLGRRLIGDRAAWIAGLGLLLCAGFTLSARFLVMDGLLGLFTTVGLLATAIGLYGRPRAIWWWVVAGIACGLGVLVKGPIALIICVPPIVVTNWLGKRQGLRRRDWVAFLLPCVLIAAPWFYLVMGNQPEFAGHFFWKHHVVRFWSAFNHQEPAWFYLPVLAIGMFPASLLLPSLAYYLFGRSSRQLSQRTAELGFLVASGIWIVMFFSISGCKLPTYVLPALPMICLALGKMIDDTTGSSDQLTFFSRYNARAAKSTTTVTLLAGLVLGVGGLVIGSPKLVIATIGFAVITCVVLLAIKIRQRNPQSIRLPWVSTVAICLLVGGFGFSCVLPEFASWRSRSQNAEQLVQQVEDDAPVIFFGVQHDAARLSITEAPIIELARDQLDELEVLATQYKRLVIITDATTAATIRLDGASFLTLRRSGSRSGIYEATTNVSTTVRTGARELPKAR